MYEGSATDLARDAYEAASDEFSDALADEKEDEAMVKRFQEMHDIYRCKVCGTKKFARAMHIFDSRVCSCVVAKGRSSSKALNRSLRRYAGYSLAMDVQLVPLWTVSGWNFCDQGSRGFNPRSKDA